MEDAYTGISVQEVTVYTDLTFYYPIRFFGHFVTNLIPVVHFYVLEDSWNVLVYLMKFWQTFSYCSTQYLMYCLAQVDPHPVTTTLVPAEISESS